MMTYKGLILASTPYKKGNPLILATDNREDFALCFDQVEGGDAAAVQNILGFFADAKEPVLITGVVEVNNNYYLPLLHVKSVGSDEPPG